MSAKASQPSERTESTLKTTPHITLALPRGHVHDDRKLLMNINNPCPIWATPASVHYLSDVDAMTVDSPRTAGFYYITGTAATVVSHCDSEVKARLTTWLIEQRQLGVERPEIPSETIENLPRHALPVHVRADRLLQYIQRSIQYVASIFALRFNDDTAQDCLEVQA